MAFKTAVRRTNEEERGFLESVDDCDHEGKEEGVDFAYLLIIEANLNSKYSISYTSPRTTQHVHLCHAKP